MNWLNEIWEQISDNAGSGAQATGAVADGILQAGLHVSALAQLLQNIAASAEATPAEVAYARRELAILQERYYEPEKSVLVPALLLGGIIYLATRD